MSKEPLKCPKCNHDLTPVYVSRVGEMLTKAGGRLLWYFIVTMVLALPTLLFAWAYHLVFR